MCVCVCIMYLQCVCLLFSNISYCGIFDIEGVLTTKFDR